MIEEHATRLPCTSSVNIMGLDVNLKSLFFPPRPVLKWNVVETSCQKHVGEQWQVCFLEASWIICWKQAEQLTSRTASPKAHTNVGSEGCREEQQPPKIRHLRQRLRSIRPWVQFVHQLLRLELLGCCAISCRGMLGIWMIKMVPENLGKVNRSTYK